MSDEDAMYEDDEPIEDLRAAWNAGEKGSTSGPRDLDQRAMSIVNRAVERFEGRQDVRLQIVSSGTATVTTVSTSGAPGTVGAMEQVEDQTATAVAYRVG
jgi:hypothetical protein